MTPEIPPELVSSRLAAIVESSDDAIIGKDLNGVITSWNGGAERLFGYAAGEIVGSSIMCLIPADRHEEEAHILGRIRSGQRVEHFETKRQTKDGRLLDVSISASPIRDASGVVVGVSKIARDFTEHNRAQEARRSTEERYRALFDQVPDGILIRGPDGAYVDVNLSLCRMLGYTRDELIGLKADDILAPGEVPDIAAALRAIDAEFEFHRERKFRRKDGSTFPADVVAANMPDGNILGIVRDITARKRHEARFRRLVDSNVQGVMFWNSSGEILGANDAYLSIIGYTRDELLDGKIRWDAITPPEFERDDKRSAEEVALHGVCAPYEKEYVRKDGSRVPILIGAASFEDAPNEGVCFVLDLTDRKKLEKQVLRVQRMESIGTVAGGIAHDLNNVLAPILMGMEIVKESVKAKDGLEYIEMMQASAEHGADLVRQLLTFARGVEGRRVSINVVQLVADLLKVMRDTFPKSIRVHFNPPKGVWAVTGDATQIHQVLMNLCVNARDAMPGGGIITVAIENAVLDETYAMMNLDSRPGAYVKLKVEDTGEGIPPAIRERIFEPFFTTKEIGKGTGLGLSTTMGIVKSHGGFIHLYSEVGVGTKFEIYLPAATTEAAIESVAVEQTGLRRGNGELVLVVDDEEAIRKIVQATLERFGYRVLAAANGAEAVALFVQHRAEIAVVLTDMAMPVMDGPATIIALKAVDPTVRIIASSGLAPSGAMTTAVGAGVKFFVPKPYTAEAVLKTLAQALQDRGST
jgi:two-component system cell cycle sensor histidine kinase/response regulator CckA